MKTSKISVIDIDKTSLIYRSNPKFDYCDVYQFKLNNSSYTPSPKECMIIFFQSFPPIFLILLQIREFISKRIGLKTSTIPIEKERIKLIDNFRGEVGDTLGIFEVLGKNHKEILTGQNDKHLDFRLSFLSYNNGTNNIEIATTVKIHNNLGRLYFLIVKPIHKYYMRNILNRMSAKYIPNRVY